MEEQFDTFDINGNFLGVKSKSFCHSGNPNCYHKPVWIWAKNDNGKILIQKRSLQKSFEPGKFGISVAGHVDAGETIIEGCIRETKEEIGIDTKPEDYTFVKEWLNQKDWELAQIYILKTNAKEEDLTIEKREADYAIWVSYEKLVELIKTGQFSDLGEELTKFTLEILK